MKQFIRLLGVLVVIFMCTNLGCAAWAASSIDDTQTLVSETVEYYEDGSSLMISIYEEVVQQRSNLYNKIGKKIYEYRDASSNILWEFAVIGEFRIIEGASVTCISASCDSEVYNDYWQCERQWAETSGSWAIAYGEFSKSLLGIVVDRENAEVSLTCDVYGNLS